MKKFLGLLVFGLLLNGCDDGNVTVDTINFDKVQANLCGDIVYKLNSNEALFMKIPASQNAFKNEISLVNTPQVFTIGGDIQVRYRAYNGTVSSSNICPDVIQPITPIATEEWIATAGTIEITTTAVYSVPDAITNATKILKYNHNIIFKNIKFAKPDGSNQVYDIFSFGDYLTTATSLPFNFDPALVAKCASGNKIYNVATSRIESLLIENIDPTLINSTIETRTQLINATTNKVVYRYYKTTVPLPISDYFCGTTTPTTPVIDQEWTAVAGVSNVSGIIEVTTTVFAGNTRKHTIKLKKVTFKKGNDTFYYGDDILYGELITN